MRGKRKDEARRSKYKTLRRKALSFQGLQDKQGNKRTTLGDISVNKLIFLFSISLFLLPPFYISGTYSYTKYYYQCSPSIHDVTRIGRCKQPSTHKSISTILSTYVLSISRMKRRTDGWLDERRMDVCMDLSNVQTNPVPSLLLLSVQLHSFLGSCDMRFDTKRYSTDISLFHIILYIKTTKHNGSRDIYPLPYYQRPTGHNFLG